MVKIGLRGDVVLFSTNDLEGKIIKSITNSDWTHMGMLRSYYKVDAVGKSGKKNHDLRRLNPNIEDYIVLEHENITPQLRQNLGTLNRLVPFVYDLNSIWKIGFREVFNNRNNKDISNKDALTESFICSTRVGYMYNQLGLEIKPDVHWSQLIPNDFYDSPYFNEK